MSYIHKRGSQASNCQWTKILTVSLENNKTIISFSPTLSLPFSLSLSLPPSLSLRTKLTVKSVFVLRQVAPPPASLVVVTPLAPVAWVVGQAETLRVTRTITVEGTDRAAIAWTPTLRGKLERSKSPSHHQIGLKNWKILIPMLTTACWSRVRRVRC